MNLQDINKAVGILDHELTRREAELASIRNNISALKSLSLAKADLPQELRSLESVANCKIVSVSLLRDETKDYGAGVSECGYVVVTLNNGGVLNIPAWCDEFYEDIGENFPKVSAFDEEIDEVLERAVSKIALSGEARTFYWKVEHELLNPDLPAQTGLKPGEDPDVRVATLMREVHEALGINTLPLDAIELDRRSSSRDTGDAPISRTFAR